MKPNILLITTDQQRWDTLSLYGKGGYKTPNLDKLALNGVYFDRAYCPQAICTPARVSLISGQYPSRHGASQIGMDEAPILRTSQTLGHLMKEAGYSTALIGKTHFVARKDEATHIGADKYDLDFWKNFDGPYQGFDYMLQGQEHNCNEKPSCSYMAWLDEKGVNVDEYFWKPGKNGPDYNGNGPQGKWGIDVELTQNAWITEKSVSYIKDKADDETPWLCWASFQDPHAPYVCPDPYYSAVDMTDVKTPMKKEGEFDNKPPFYKNYSENGQWDDGNKNFWAGHIVSCTWNTDKDPNMLSPIDAKKSYIGMVNMIDDYVGKIIDSLEETGQFENTMIIFTTDHGDFLGEHGWWEKGLPSYDDNQRIPAIISWADGQKQKIGKTDSMFNLVDILPTCLDAAGAEIPPLVQGVSQLPILRSETEMLKDWALIEYQNYPSVYQQTLIHDNHRLVVYRDADYGELYNLDKDPNQYDNLFNNPEYNKLQQKLMQKLLQVNMEKEGIMVKRVANA